MHEQYVSKLALQLSRRGFLSGSARLAGGTVGLLAVGCGESAESARIPQRTIAPQPTIVPQTVPASAPPQFPLRVADGGRFLVDQTGAPVVLQGDSPWSLIANLTLDEARVYLADRQHRGFNALLVNLLEHKFAINAPANRMGQQPFTTPGDFSTPNESYFQHAEEVVAQANTNGLAVFLTYLYPGYMGTDQGWWEEVNSPANTREVCFEYGRYVGERFKDHSNVVFVAGGDFMPPQGSEGEARLYRVLEGLRAAGATQLHTGIWHAPAISTDSELFAADMAINSVYSYGEGASGRTYVEARRGFEDSDRPTILLETGYEAEGWAPGDRTSIRKYLWWAALGGATAGVFYGHRDVWPFADGNFSSGFGFGVEHWQDSLGADGALDTQTLGTFMRSLPWQEFAPAGSGGMPGVIVDGGGDWGGDDFVTAVVSGGGDHLVAYLPPHRGTDEVGVDAKQLAAQVGAEWFDPASGSRYDAVALGGGDTLTYQTPGQNAAGADDWVLHVFAPEAGGPERTNMAHVPGLARERAH